MTSFSRSQLVASLLITALAAGCGGGSKSNSGSSGSSSAAGATLPGQGNSANSISGYAVGVFESTSTNGDTAYYTVLPTGEYYGAIYNGSGLFGLAHGSASDSSGTAIQSSNLTFYATQASNGGSVSAGGTLTANFPSTASDTFVAAAAGQTLSTSGTGQLTYGPANFTSIYSQALALSALAGSYNGELDSAGLNLSMQSAAMTLSANGSYSLTVGNCTASGNLSASTPASGIYRATLTLSGASCSASGASAQGIVTPVSSMVDGGGQTHNHLLFQLISSDGSKAAVLDMGN
jgi:hypothetical protein